MFCFFVNLPVVKIPFLFVKKTSISEWKCCTAYVVHMLRSYPLQSAWNPANLGQSRQRRRNQRITNSQLAGCQKFIRENISQFLYDVESAKMMYHKRKSYWCTCLQVYFSVTLSSIFEAVSGVLRFSGEHRSNISQSSDQEAFVFFCIKMFLQDGVLVGSRLGEEMFTSSTKMLKVRVSWSPNWTAWIFICVNIWI